MPWRRRPGREGLHPRPRQRHRIQRGARRPRFRQHAPARQGDRGRPRDPALTLRDDAEPAAAGLGYYARHTAFAGCLFAFAGFARGRSPRSLQASFATYGNEERIMDAHTRQASDPDMNLDGVLNAAVLGASLLGRLDRGGLGLRRHCLALRHLGRQERGRPPGRLRRAQIGGSGFFASPVAIARMANSRRAGRGPSCSRNPIDLNLRALASDGSPLPGDLQRATRAVRLQVAELSSPSCAGAELPHTT